MRTTRTFLVVTAMIASLTGCKTNQPAPEPTPPAVQPPTPTAAQTPASSPTLSVVHTPALQTMSPATTKPVGLILKFNSSSIDAIQAGTKTSTTRKGIRAFSGNKVTAIDSSDADRTLSLDIVSAIPKKLSDLTEADAKSDGSGSLDTLKTAMTTNYPGITGDDMVTVITFKVAK